MLYLRAVLSIILIILSGPLTVDAATAPTKMIVAYASISPRVAPLWVAQEQ